MAFNLLRDIERLGQAKDLLEVECLRFNGKELEQEVGEQHEIQPKEETKTILPSPIPCQLRVRRPHRTQTTGTTKAAITTMYAQPSGAGQ